MPSRAEPLHPGAPLALLLGGLILVATCLDGPRWRGAAGFGGVLLATMLLIKVNVGLFAAVGIARALAAAGLPGRLRVAVVAGIAAVPVLLLAPRVYEPTVRAYLAVALASALGMALVALASPPGRLPIGGRALTFAACGALTLGVCMAAAG